VGPGLKESRTLAFINAGLDLAALSLVGEAGTFFAGLGLRLDF
jgi:hypothetical protein